MSRNELEKETFDNLGISEGLLKRIKSLGFVHPTPIQFKAIPIATSGQDVVGIAQTGSGKTLAFSIPALQQISEKGKMALILLPTRELAVQVEETIRKISGKSGLKTAIIIGGTNPRPQIRQLKAKPHIIVATPGRLIDHIEQKHISLKNVGILILDEADRMLDMGFEPQLKEILTFVPEDRQTMLFSATMPAAITSIAKKYMHTPLRIEVSRPGTTADKIDQEVYMVSKSEKLDTLKSLLKEYKGKVLIFSRTKHGAKKIALQLRKWNFTADEIHSNRTQNQRQKALKGFTSGRYRILVATDIASRGIDVDNIALVINYDLPDQLEDYVHRIGRTGRAGKSGKAISFAVQEQKRDIIQIQKLINIILPIKSSRGEDLAPIKDQGLGARPRRQSRNRNYSGGKRGSYRGHRSNSRTGRSRENTSGSGGNERRRRKNSDRQNRNSNNGSRRNFDRSSKNRNKPSTRRSGGNSRSRAKKENNGHKHR